MGPKAAAAVLSELSPEKVALAVASGDYKTITRAQGVGPKLAQRIVLEMKDKVGESGRQRKRNASRWPGFCGGSGRGGGFRPDYAGVYTRRGQRRRGKLDSSLPVEELVRLSLKALGRKG